MKTKLSLVVLIISAFVITNSGCKKKEKIKGCMDARSINHNPGAEEDDGSCVYKATIIVWWDQSFTQSGYIYNAYNEENGKLLKDSIHVFSRSWTSAPSCGASNVEKFYITWTAGSISYMNPNMATNPVANGDTYYTGIYFKRYEYGSDPGWHDVSNNYTEFTMHPNECYIVQLHY